MTRARLPGARPAGVGIVWTGGAQARSGAEEDTAMSLPEAGRLLDALFTTERMRAICSDHGRVRGMLDFEAALARAEARVGVIPLPAAEAIASHCRAELFDMAALGQGAALA